MKYEFESKSKDSHINEEEYQWVKILAKGNPYAGMLLVYSQKLCAVAHEFGNAMVEGQINKNNAGFYASRLKGRAGKILEILSEEPDLSSRKTFEGLIIKLEEFGDNQASYDAFKEIPEKIHMASHELCDELYIRLK